MLDIKRIRQSKEEVVAGLQKRNGHYPIDEVLALDTKRRDLLAQVEEKKAERNRVSREIPERKKRGEEVGETLAAMKALGEEIKSLDEAVRTCDAELQALLLSIPNVPHRDVAVGADDSANVEQRRWGEPRKFDFEAKPHWDLGTELQLLDFDRGTKLSGARFTAFTGRGARLERSLINFMLDLHTQKHGFTEMAPPFLVNRASMTGTGQLPKFEEDMYHCEVDDLFLIPTAEVPVTNFYRDDILSEADLPIYFTAYTPCFRREAGSAGRDTRGLIRQHQFDKVEMVKFSTQEKSYEELESLTRAAEEVLQALEIPYRVVQLCTGDLGFSSAMTYDLEVWMPSYGRYVEISSCSNFEDFQARRANIRYRDAEGKLQYVHTLNGSGLAVGRTFAAILENCQLADGSIRLPKALVPYYGSEMLTK